MSKMKYIDVFDRPAEIGRNRNQVFSGKKSTTEFQMAGPL